MLSILMVTHNSSDVLPACLESVRSNPPSCDYEIIVCDNGSSDDTLNMLRSGLWCLQTIDNTQNLGFAGGNMLAAREARGDLLLLLNPDTIVLPGALDTLVEALLADERHWVAGACLLTAEGGFNSAWGDFQTVGWAVANTAPWLRLGIHIKTKCRVGCTGEGMTSPVRVDWVSGAAFLVRRSAWDALGGLYSGYFMYFEETDLCSRVHEAGGDVILVPAARIVHFEGTSVGQASQRQRIWFTEGLIRFLGRREGSFAALVVRVWVSSIYAVLWLGAVLVGVFSARARAKRHLYASLVRVGLGLTVSYQRNGV
ncbi:MAG: glycosyltransferase family 2 protein [Coriobacteriia bacterium]|nr:glycosyltransferase family 2 protein [Coriobacteriia bacterium]